MIFQQKKKMLFIHKIYVKINRKINSIVVCRSLASLWTDRTGRGAVSSAISQNGAMKNFAAGRNDNRFIYSVSPKTREREDWTARTNVIERTAN